MDVKKSLREAREGSREHSLAFPVKTTLWNKKTEESIGFFIRSKT